VIRLAGNQTVEGVNLTCTEKAEAISVQNGQKRRREAVPGKPANLPPDSDFAFAVAAVPSTALPRKHLTNAKKRGFLQGILERGESR
jgi:hypothetical protein